MYICRNTCFFFFVERERANNNSYSTYIDREWKTKIRRPDRQEGMRGRSRGREEGQRTGGGVGAEASAEIRTTRQKLVDHGRDA